MEKVYKTRGKYFGMSTGLQLEKKWVEETSPGCYWSKDVRRPVQPVQEIEMPENPCKGQKGY
jgi:hypothetical protein